MTAETLLCPGCSHPTDRTLMVDGIRYALVCSTCRTEVIVPRIEDLPEQALDGSLRFVESENAHYAYHKDTGWTRV